ncbi:MAG: CDP-alcohol phosphatidyltransferase family protein [Deferrisomatales bacterium]|nr:CDP-alcohol phosphatidyltransferase family protein [Deferrisomatales bacterium]
MNVYLAILFQLVLPVLGMLALERFLVFRMIRTPGQIAWVRSHVLLHPNVISRMRYPMGVVTVLLYHFGWPRAAFLFFTFWMITDLTDGDIARKCDLSTRSGESIDPFSDKLMYTPLLVYLAWKGEYNAVAVSLFLVFDFAGQVSRRFITRTAANLFGKAKTFLVVVLFIITGLVLIYGPLPFLGRMIHPLLVFCTGLAICSTAFKIIPNYWYANILSLMNMVCGLLGAALILRGGDPLYAFGLVFLGQFLDLFDGRAAERWGSTPRGEIFDDVADGTTFGLAVGLIIVTSFQHLSTGLLLGALHLGATIYRLVRFVVEKRKDGVAGGVAMFSGMPSPGGALLAGSACLLLPWELWKGSLVLASAVLMVSRVPYAHFGRSVMGKVPKFVRVLVLALFLVLLAVGVRRDEYAAPLAIVFMAATSYLLSPLFAMFANRGRRS